MKVLELLPVNFDQAALLRGELESVEVIGDRFVLQGTPDNIPRNIWLAATGSLLPENIVHHLQTYIWNDPNQGRLVVHVFETKGTPFYGRGHLRVYRERVAEDFYLDVGVEDFLHLEEDQGRFDVWFITDAQPMNATDHYKVRSAQVRTDGTRYFSNDDFTIHKADSTASGRFSTSTTLSSASQVIPAAVENGMVFEYEKQDGNVRLVRCKHVEFIVIDTRQAIKAWDLDRKDWRTFYLDQIVEFPEVRV